jgi:VanZ family protein
MSSHVASDQSPALASSAQPRFPAIASARHGLAASGIGALWLVICWTLVIVVLSSQPDLDEAGGHRLRVGIFALGHGVFFTALGFLVANLFTRLGLRRIVWWTFVIATMFAVLDELHQAIVPGRDPSGIDLALDGLGAFLGGLAFVRGTSSASATSAPALDGTDPDPHRGG